MCCVPALRPEPGGMALSAGPGRPGVSLVTGDVPGLPRLLGARSATQRHRPSTDEMGVASISAMRRGAEDVSERDVGEQAAADRELAGRLAAGDPDALADAYRRYSGLVFGVCRRVLNDPTLAEDVTQEVFVHLWQSPERFDASRGTMRSWLGVLAHSRSLDRVRAECRRSRREARSDRSAAVDPAPNEVDDHLTATWVSDRVRTALRQLPSEQREAVELAYFGHRTYRQVAVELAIPEGTAKSRLRLALGKLDELLRSDFIGEDAQAWI
jgi:RNA polymerase sigma factor (sigma-70 family)